MKKVAGFHSLVFGFVFASLERRKGFGTRDVQKPVSATVGRRALFARIWHARGAEGVARTRVVAERASSLLVAILSISASTIRSTSLEMRRAHGKNQSSAPPAVFFPMFGMEGVRTSTPVVAPDNNRYLPCMQGVNPLLLFKFRAKCTELAAGKTTVFSNLFNSSVWPSFSL